MRERAAEPGMTAGGGATSIRSRHPARAAARVSARQAGRPLLAAPREGCRHGRAEGLLHNRPALLRRVGWLARTVAVGDTEPGDRAQGPGQPHAQVRDTFTAQVPR
jgi:hypothetical protein